MNERLKEKFDRVADQYDSQRHYLIPCLEDFYGIAVDLVELESGTPEILDMGAGTGLLTQYLYQKYEHGNYTLIDLSGDMLEVARERFKGMENFGYLQETYLDYAYGKNFDAVVSALSIHHLSNEDKLKVYQKAYDDLKEGGIFINADQVLGATDKAEAVNRVNWLKRIEGSPLSDDEKKAAYSRMAMDRMATLDENIGMLEGCGFREVEVYYKYYNFAVICGVK